MVETIKRCIKRMEPVKKEIGSTTRPVVFELQEFKGNRFVSIREYYTDKNDGEKKPGKKGYTLNKYKLLEFVNFLNENSETIKEFLDSEEEISQVQLDYKNLLGRSFNIEYSNGETTLFLDSSLASKFSDEQLVILKKTLIGIYDSLLSVFDIEEDKEQINTVLDYFSNKLNRF